MRRRYDRGMGFHSVTKAGHWMFIADAADGAQGSPGQESLERGWKGLACPLDSASALPGTGPRPDGNLRDLRIRSRVAVSARGGMFDHGDREGPVEREKRQQLLWTTKFDSSGHASCLNAWIDPSVRQ